MNNSFRCMFLGFALLAASGCRTERPPTTNQAEAERTARIAATPVGPSPVSRVDDARLVVAACGQPISDQVTAIYDKLENGPLRRMRYDNGQPVTLDFVPSLPVAHPANAAALVRQPRFTQVSANAIWRFDEAHMQQRDILTSKRLAFYLPCAAAALYPEN